MIALFFAAIAGLALAVSRNKAFEVDEVEHIHVAYNISDGRIPYADFWEGHPPALYMVLQPVVHVDDAGGSFRRSRAVLFAILIMHLGLIGYCGYKLSGKLGGILAAGFAGLHSTMVERSIEVRPDGPMSLCVTAALALELSGQGRLRRYSLQGALLGTAVLFSQKAVFACLAFGCLWLLAAIRQRSARLIVLPMLAWAAPLTFGAAGLALTGSLDEFWTTTVVASARSAARTEAWMQTFQPTNVLLTEGLKNPLFLAASVWSLFAVASAARKQVALAFPLSLGLVLVASLWANPFPFAYLHVTVIPVVAVLVSYVVVQSFHRYRMTEVAQWFFAAAWLALAGMFSVPQLIGKVDSESQVYQMATLAEVQRITEPHDPVFDLVGLYFRPDAYPVFSMSRHMVCRYIAGGFDSIPDALRRNETPVVLTNYRVHWFFNIGTGETCAPAEKNEARRNERGTGDTRAASVKRFIGDHYVAYSGNIRVLGTKLWPGAEKRLEILKAAEYRFDGTGSLLLDGEPFDRGELAKGFHHAISASGGRLLLVTPEPWPNPGEPRRMYFND